MSTRFPTYGWLLLFVGFAGTAACDRADRSVTAPSSLAVATTQSPFAAEPLTIHPEFLHSASCVTRPPFQGRVTIIVRGGQGVIVRGLGFNFTDRFGRRSIPDVSPVPGIPGSTLPASTIPTSSPVPLPGGATLPGASPVSIPGSSPVQGIFVPSGTARPLPFDLRFGCGVVPDGLLLITVDAGDQSGRFGPAELRVRIGS